MTAFFEKLKNEERCPLPVQRNAARIFRIDGVLSQGVKEPITNSAPALPTSIVRCVVRPVESLQPHNSYVRHHLSVSPFQLSALAQRGEMAFLEPIIINHDGTILDGYALWHLANTQGRKMLHCLEHELSEVEALEFFLLRHQRPSHLNDFIRILLALDLEPFLRDKAKRNQRYGGGNKGSSNLAEADTIDVRRSIASVAGVSPANLSKVKYLNLHGCAELKESLRLGDVSIHRAWSWTKQTPKNQLTELQAHLGEKGIRRTIRRLASRHRCRPVSDDLNFTTLVDNLSIESRVKATSIRVTVIKGAKPAIFLTQAALELLGLQKELSLS